MKALRNKIDFQYFKKKNVCSIFHTFCVYLKGFRSKTALVKVFVAIWILILFHAISVMSLLHMSTHFNAVLLGFKSHIPFAVKCTFFEIWCGDAFAHQLTVILAMLLLPCYINVAFSFGKSDASYFWKKSAVYLIFFCK